MPCIPQSLLGVTKTMTKMIPGKAGPTNSRVKSGRIPVSTNFYGNRDSFGGKDGLGAYDTNEHLPHSEGDPETAQRQRNYSNDVPNGWLRGGTTGVPGVTDERPHFDRD